MVSLASISLKGLTGHWTKWGGNVHDVFSRQNEEITNWFCQSCNSEQDKEITPFFFEYPDKEYIRICQSCQTNGCLILKSRIEFIEVEVIKSNFD